MKNNIEYYRHMVDSSNHPKFKALRRKYGWAGEGMFWALNGMIGKSEGCRLNLGEEYIFSEIAHDFGMSDEQLKAFLDCLVNHCKLVARDGDFITTEMVQENLDKVNAERERNRSKRSPKNKNHGATTVETDSKGKESKVNKSKGKGKTREDALPPDQDSTESNATNPDTDGTKNQNLAKPGAEKDVREVEFAKFARSMRRELVDLLDGTDYDVPEFADEVARVWVEEDKSFNAKSPGSKKGAKTWIQRYAQGLPRKPRPAPPEDAPVEELTRPERVARIYREKNHRILSGEDLIKLRALTREYVVKGGFSDEDLAMAFGHIRHMGGNYEDLSHVFKNLPKLISGAQNRAA